MQCTLLRLKTYKRLLLREPWSPQLQPPRYLQPGPAENYGVDIGAPFRALLPVLAFEGATKRNRPQLQVRPFRPCAPSQGAGTRLWA